MVLNGIPISDDECIGDSLATINSAFQSISSAVTQVESNSAFNVVDSPTIDLDWNASTRTLSAAAITSTLSTLLTSSLSAAAFNAKAWATYDGIADTLNKDYGVLSITRTNTGRYTVTFDSNFSDTNYCTVVGGIDNKLEVSSRTLSSLNLTQVTGTTYNDSNYICIAIFA